MDEKQLEEQIKEKRKGKIFSDPLVEAF